MSDHSTPRPPDLMPFLAGAGSGTGSGLAFVDRDARFLFISDSLARINGLPAAAHLGRTIAEVVPALWDQVEPCLARVLAGEAVALDLHGVTPADPDHVRTWAELWSPVLAPGGEVLGASVTVVDVTDLRLSQARAQELVERQSALRGVANAALSDAPMQEVFQAALLVLREHLGVPYARMMRISPGSDRLVVYAEAGWDPEKVRLNPVGPRTGSFADYVLQRSAPVQFEDLETELRFRRPPLFLEHGVRAGIGARVSSGDRPWGQLAAYDTRTRRFDCDEVAFIEELAAILGLMVHERDSRAFREEVLSMASHQMRTPLTSVIGLAQHIQRRAAHGRTESAVELVDSLVAEAFRLDDVLSQWNELAAAESYREAFAADPVDVARVVAECVEQFRARHLAPAVAETYPDPSVVIASDGRRIGEIIDNLLENARKYGGDSLIEVTVEPRPAGVALHCRDRGPGVPPEIAPYIFDRFYRGTSTAAHSGMGLGLYISRKLAEGLGGTLDVTSTPGDGACFTLFLPVERRRDERASEAAEHVPVRS